MIKVTLYSRQGCHLCEQARADLDQLRKKIPHQLEVVDIESDTDLLRQYAQEKLAASPNENMAVHLRYSRIFLEALAMVWKLRFGGMVR